MKNRFFPLVWLLTCLVMLTTVEISFGQQGKIDSLFLVLSKAKEDSGRVNTINSITRELINTGDYDKAKQYATDALSLSQKIMYKKGEWKSYNNLGIVYEEQGNYTEALKNQEASLNIAKEINDKKGIASSYNEIGIIYKNLGHYHEALENYFSALKMQEEMGEKRGIASAYHNIGIVYELQGNYPEALKSQLSALKIREEINNKKDIAFSYNEIGIVYMDQSNYPEALKNYFAALKLQEEIGDKSGAANSYMNIGIIYKMQGNYPEALINYSAALKLQEQIGTKIGIASSYNNLGAMNIKLKKYTEAKKYLDDALSLSIKIGSNIEIKSCYRNLARLDSATGSWKEAYLHQDVYMLYSDSLVNQENIKKTVQAQMNYEFEKKEAITKAEHDKKEALATAEIKRQTLIKNSTLGGVGIAGIFSFLLVRSFNRRRKTSFEKQVSEVEMKALRSQMNPHFIFNSLQSIKKYVLENARNDAAEYLSKFSTLMRLILENSRKQEVSLEKDLSALELYMELESLRFQNRFQFAIEVDPKIDKEDTLIAPLLLQPFVENSIIHGISSKENGMIKIRVNKKDNMIHCTVEDNGIGRDQSVQLETGEKKKRESLGMKITHERLSIINQLKKVKTAVNIFDLKDEDNKPGGLRVELLLPFETAF